MDFKWTAHRFAGGILAFDVVNTVICRGDPLRRLDRFADRANIASFAAAATDFRAKEFESRTLLAPADDADIAALVNLREAINAWMRPLAQQQEPPPGALNALFAACAAVTENIAAPDAGYTLGHAAALSAMQLFDSGIRRRVKICPNCDWLFVDRSKNASRLWCDMAVCGNRAKAKAHYRRHANPAFKQELAS